jgi:hypothetical protein
MSERVALHALSMDMSPAACMVLGGASRVRRTAPAACC